MQSIAYTLAYGGPIFLVPLGPSKPSSSVHVYGCSVNIATPLKIVLIKYLLINE